MGKLYVKQGTLTIDFDAVCDAAGCDSTATHFSTRGTKFCPKHEEANNRASGIRLVSEQELLERSFSFKGE